MQKDSEAFAGADEVSDEELITDGAVIDEGTGDQFSDEELEILSALPVPSGAVETESGAESDGAELFLVLAVGNAFTPPTILHAPKCLSPSLEEDVAAR